MENYVKTAERVISDFDVKKITTSKIRGLLTGISDIYNDVVRIEGDELGKDILKRIEYLKVQFVYSAGRDRGVKEFIEKSKMIEEIDKIGNSKERFLDMARYMEALVAYHRFKGGRDE